MNSNHIPDLSQTNTGQPPESVAEPPSIEGYRIKELLGQGGMGVVWRAEQIRPQRDVALKLMRSDVLRSDTARARFQVEMEVAATLEHPSIARVYQCNLDKPPYYFTMELIQGRRLDDYVQQNQLSHRQILILIRSICSALAHAHQHGVIHRDLKPSNILVTNDNQPFILDFGVAKRLGDDSKKLTISDSARGPGTLAYMSPEQVTGKAVDTRSDVYTLGVLIYKLLAGKFPFDVSGSEYKCMQRIEKKDPIPLRRLVPNIDTDLETIVLATLAKDPYDRYQSMSELAKDIDNWLSDLPLSIKTVKPLYLIRKLVTRYRFVSTVIGLLIVITIGFSCMSFYWYLNAVESERRAISSADEYKEELQTLKALVRPAIFTEFFQAWQQDNNNWANHTYRFLSFGSKERSAAMFLLRLLGEPAFVKLKSEGHAWFVNYITAEYYLKKGDRKRAQKLFESSQLELPEKGGDSFSRTDRMESWVAYRLQERLRNNSVSD